MPGVFAEVVHCIELSNAGLLYVCDRQGDRIQVFDKRVPSSATSDPEPDAQLSDPRGTAWWVDFSPRPAAEVSLRNEWPHRKVHVLDHDSGQILVDFGRPGHQLGNFTHGHTLAVDSTGNIYVAETDWGRRVQKFKPVN